jgi:hypothetical protein
MESYWSGSLGSLYFDDIEEDMRKFSDMAKELNTTTENILRYAIIQKLDIAASLDGIKDCLEEIKEAISNIKD